MEPRRSSRKRKTIKNDDLVNEEELDKLLKEEGMDLETEDANARKAEKEADFVPKKKRRTNPEVEAARKLKREGIEKRKAERAKKRAEKEAAKAERAAAKAAKEMARKNQRNAMKSWVKNEELAEFGTKVWGMGQSAFYKGKFYHYGGLWYYSRGRWNHVNLNRDFQGYNFNTKRNFTMYGSWLKGKQPPGRQYASTINCNNIAVIFGGARPPTKKSSKTQFFDLDSKEEIKVKVVEKEAFPDSSSEKFAALTIKHGDADRECLGAMQIYYIDDQLWTLKCIAKGKWEWKKRATKGEEPGSWCASFHWFHDFKDRVLLLSDKIYELIMDERTWRWEVFMDKCISTPAGIVHHHLICPERPSINLRTKELVGYERLRRGTVKDDAGNAVTPHSLVVLSSRKVREFRVPNIEAGGWYDKERKVWWSPRMVMIASLILWIDFTVTDDPEEDECQWKFLPLEVMERIFSYMLLMEPERMTLPEDPWDQVDEEEWKKTLTRHSGDYMHFLEQQKNENKK